MPRVRPSDFLEPSCDLLSQAHAFLTIELARIRADPMAEPSQPPIHLSPLVCFLREKASLPSSRGISSGSDTDDSDSDGSPSDGSPNPPARRPSLLPSSRRLSLSSDPPPSASTSASLARRRSKVQVHSQLELTEREFSAASSSTNKIVPVDVVSDSPLPPSQSSDHPSLVGNLANHVLGAWSVSRTSDPCPNHASLKR